MLELRFFTRLLFLSEPLIPTFENQHAFSSSAKVAIVRGCIVFYG